MDNNNNEPVVVVTTADNYILAVGDPAHFSAKELKKYMQQKCTIQTTTMDVYKHDTRKWIWDKPNAENHFQAPLNF